MFASTTITCLLSYICIEIYYDAPQPLKSWLLHDYQKFTYYHIINPSPSPHASGSAGPPVSLTQNQNVVAPSCQQHCRSTRAEGRDPRPEKEGTNYIEVVVDSNAVQIESRTIILQVIESTGINVPRFCFHERLSVAGNYRICLVEIEKSIKPVRAPYGGSAVHFLPPGLTLSQP